MQSGVEINGSDITGTLNYVTGYTGFSGKTSEQEGNYLALKCETEDADDVITVELVNGTVGHPVTLDADRNIVIRITDPATQWVRVIATHDGVSVTKSYWLRNLTLEASDEP